MAEILPLFFLACIAGAPASAWAAEAPAAAAPPAPTAEAAVLELPDDGFLLGRFAPSGAADGRTRATFHWQSPLFAQPIEFRLDAIRRIRLAKQPVPPAAESWRAELQGGDIAMGELDAIDAKHVVMRVPGVGGGPLRIRRAAVVRLASPTAALKVIVPGDAAVEAFDRAKGSFTVRTGDVVREVPAAEVSAIEFPALPPAAPPPAAAVVAAFHGGSRLTANVVEVTPSALRLDCPAVADPLECGLAQLAVLEPRATSTLEVAGRPGLLEAAGGRMLGCLVGPAGAGIGWQPRGAVAPVAVGPTAAMRIRYRGLAAGKKNDVQKPAAKPADGPATVYCRTGESIQCMVLSAGPEGVRIKTDLEADVLVPTAAMRAMELLPASASGIPKEKLARLLTLPRMQQANPPTHVLRLTSGDYLRGKLVSLDEKTVRFDVLGTVKELPRSQAARLIWLSVVGDDSEQRSAAVSMGAGEAGGVRARGTATDGRRLSIAATSIDGDRLVGRNGVFGAASIDLSRCDHLDLGPAAVEAPPGAIPYSQWQLQPAAPPRALAEP